MNTYEKPLKVLVCGTNFGRVYLKGLATNLRLQVFFLMEAHNQSKKQKNMEFH